MPVNTMDTDVANLLTEGKVAVKSGDIVRGRQILTEVVERDPHNEMAWMWLSGVVDEAEEQQICLENVLVINPYNSKARKGLDFISTKTGIPPHTRTVPVEATAPLSDMQVPVEPGMIASSAPQPPASAPGYGSLPSWTLTTGDPAAGDPAAYSAQQPSPYAGEPNMPKAATGHDALFTSSPFQLAPDEPVSKDAIPPWAVSGSMKESMTFGGFGDMPGASMPTMLPHQAPSDTSTSAPGLEVYVPGSFQAITGMSGAPELEMPSWLADSSAQQAQAPTPRAETQHAEAPAAPMFSFASDRGPNDHFDIGNSDASADEVAGLGLYAGAQLPSPSELPGYSSGSQAAQPWYVQSGDAAATAAPARMPEYARPSAVPDEMSTSLASKEPAVTIECPQCHGRCLETALSCPHCQFEFFVNCPHCHELIDTGDALPNREEPCPYCAVPVNKMDLGSAGGNSAAPYASHAMDGQAEYPADGKALTLKKRRYLGFAWVADLAWLAAIIVMVWALTQLPTWLHLTGQY